MFSKKSIVLHCVKHGYEEYCTTQQACNIRRDSLQLYLTPPQTNASMSFDGTWSQDSAIYITIIRKIKYQNMHPNYNSHPTQGQAVIVINSIFQNIYGDNDLIQSNSQISQNILHSI